MTKTTENCTGCTDPHSEGTHQLGTIQHPETTETWEEEFIRRFTNYGTGYHLCDQTEPGEVIDFIRAEIAFARQEGEKAEREKVIEELFEIEKNKWEDAEHCSCMGYALLVLSGGEESENGMKMQERLLALTNPHLP